MPATADDFKNALRHFASGVTIVTIRAGKVEHGLTVSAFVSVSTDPPLVCVMVDRKHRAHELLEEEGAVFAVNILAEGHSELSNRFAWLKEGDRFAEGSWTTAETGARVLTDAASWLDCEIESRFEAGTHTAYFGRVVAAGAADDDARPLLYWNRDYRTVGDPPG